MSSSSSPQITGQQQPLRSAMKTDEECASNPAKVVQIAEPEADAVAPPPPAPPSDHHHKRQYAANMAKRLTGRMGLTSSSSSRSSPVMEPSPGPSSDDATTAAAAAAAAAAAQPSQHHHRHGHKAHYESQKLLAQLNDWLEHEKKKKAARKSKTSPRRRSPQSKTKKERSPAAETADPTAQPAASRPRSDSIDSDSSDVSFDRLQRIIEDSMASMGISSVPQMSPKVGRRPSLRHKKSLSRSMLHRTASSDTDYIGEDVVVPTCDAILDNSKTLSYSGGGKSTDDLTLGGQADEKEKAWETFKNEIVRLAHTLRIKGWRRVPLDSGNNVIVKRLSGALTNAVYVVSPPEDLEEVPGKKPPPKLLLRIYGLEALIDRENELSVLRRLARKKIGPRLLGCFTNGRFEEYFNSITLTPNDLRDPDTSKQIAKRMRELHFGIDVLEREKDEGPAVLKNWDAWLGNVEKKICALDEGVRNGNCVFRDRGYVCGVEWKQFKELYDKYRELALSAYKGHAIRERLVFAHNDTQYGNILRMRPEDEKSPLLKPANEHKQLVVIDFEYAAANVPGLEFANHFTEWSYNYHHESLPFVCNTAVYPTIQEQRRFLKAYVEHRPQYTHGGASTPRLTPAGAADGSSAVGTPALLPTSSSSSIVEFMLDARVPPNHWKEEERRAEEAVEAEIKELYEETRLWRGINSAQWVAWGVVQAKVPGFESQEEIEQQEKQAQNEAAAAAGDADAKAEVQAAAEAEAEDEGDEYDYLGYAQERAFFFLGDCVLMGIVKKEELPEDVQARLKIVDY
ncbi:hypothetical protein COL5a_006224 [Colletotrichum fioriniae]|nr:uncharacterized protein COL516b_012195 [Colletotrichum fioriniae]KAJ0295863.1 hypothetical protein COL516b_012195 [Colletotrichum fioriniae]KAJ0327050.1 hypothetical protein COL5a_006224 [Colletotrichum fioriniae]